MTSLEMHTFYWWRNWPESHCIPAQALGMGIVLTALGRLWCGLGTEQITCFFSFVLSFPVQLNHWRSLWSHYYGEVSVFSLVYFMDSGLISRSVIHFKLTLVYDICRWVNFCVSYFVLIQILFSSCKWLTSFFKHHLLKMCLKMSSTVCSWLCYHKFAAICQL